MASGDTKTNQYLDIAANGTRADLPTDTCCETRTQSLIRGVAERVIGVEEEVERLENNPDVVDIVATYADLQDYDTSGLTDKDIIRVLEDSTHDNNSTYYRWNATTNQFDFVGETSGGSSYTAGDGIDITNDVISAINTGKAKLLTTADYNYPATNPDGVALWLLDAGIYYSGPGTYIYNRSGNRSVQDSTYIVGLGQSDYTPVAILYASGKMYYGVLAKDNGGAVYPYSPLLSGGDIVDSLTSTSTTAPLSANQGKVLKDLVGSLVVRGAGAPTTSTVGQVGTLYEDTTNGDLYICTDATNPYVWEEVGAGGGSGPTVVQTTGTSTTDVMSQNAIYQALSGSGTRSDNYITKIRIGDGAYLPTGATGRGTIALLGSAGGRGSIGIGYGANARVEGSDSAWADNIALGTYAGVGNVNNARGAIALGAYSRAVSSGEINVGVSTSEGGTSTFGYGNTMFRVIRGLHDGEQANDAVTVSQVNSVIDAINTALSTNIPHIGA